MDDEQPKGPQLRSDVQDGLLRTIRHGAARRTWSINLFFRILTPQQFRLMLLYHLSQNARFTYVGDPVSQTLAEHPELLDLVETGLSTAIAPGSGGEGGLDPRALFRAWINKLVTGDITDWRRQVVDWPGQLGLIEGDRSWADDMLGGHLLTAFSGLSKSNELFGTAVNDLTPDTFDTFKNGHRSIGDVMVESGLVAVCFYEFVRQMQITQNARETRFLRATPQDVALLAELNAGNPYDRSPINIAFTHQGLSELEVEEETLSSFPEPFKEGMASRAAILGDTGPSAPGHWDGRLGQNSIHGVLTGGFAAPDASTTAWTALHKQVATFNEAGPGQGETLRRAIDLLFLFGGVQIVHIELGQDPFHVGAENKPVFPAHRTEHFGFRDGIGQPFRDLDLNEASIGNGVFEQGSWRNLAAGEIYLGHDDEDAAKSPLPTNSRLRGNGTYQVFRKLEQDVALFHSFASDLYPAQAAQEKLKARIVGRWPNGADLVRNPHAEPSIVNENKISNFLFRRDDPDGAACPLGAHVRRVNPRDIGDTDVYQADGSTVVDAAVRRHRIQRRSISYGGAFLGADPDMDAVPRGLLFSAYNARIDIQFEVIQSRWIDRGAFLGQAGLGRDALVGANLGRPHDQFQEPDKPTPIPEMPAFVTTRGGDYFFVPSLTALQDIANGQTFPTDPSELGGGFDEPRQPGLFSVDAVLSHIQTILGGQQRTVRVVPESKSEDPGATPSHLGPSEVDAALPVEFVARHEDVTHVLNSEEDTAFTVKRYRRVSINQTGGKMLLALQRAGTDKPDRIRLTNLLQNAWQAMGGQVAANRIAAIFENHAATAVASAKASGQIDLVHELITQAAYKVVTDVFGVTGPAQAANTLKAISLPDTLIDALHPDWKTALKSGSAPSVGMVSLVAWSSASLLDLVLNINEHGDISKLGTSAGRAFSAHLKEQIANWTPPQQGVPPTLLQALMQLAPAPDDVGHQTDVRLILIELVGSMMSILPQTFGRLMHTLLSTEVNLPLLVPALDTITVGLEGPVPANHAIERLIYETLRLNPAPVPLLRHVGGQGAVLPGGVQIPGPCWVAALTSGAGFDAAAFPAPRQFSLHPVLPGPVRRIENYMPFGPDGGGKTCWGRKLAMAAMVRGVRAASELSGLRRVAGPTGEPLELLKITVGLQAKCARV